MKIEELKVYFSGYAGSFDAADPDSEKSLRLKVAHTLRVYDEAVSLAEAEGFDASETQMLMFAAMLHDFSRFEQISKYHTMNDIESFDHGERSWELVQKRPELLEDFSEDERRAVLTAIRFHNRLKVPENLTEKERKILLAVRDADKIDIMQILIGHLKNPDNPAIVYKLADDCRLTPEVREAMLSGHAPDNRVLKSSLDFLAAKLAWGYDLNYAWTCREFLRRKLLEELHRLLPSDEEVLRIIMQKVLIYMQRKGKENA